MSASPQQALLSVENLSKRFDSQRGLFGRAGHPLTAIDRVSLEIKPSQIYGLVGESGSGKSTLGRAILQLVIPDAGQVLFRGTDLCTADRERLREARKKLQAVFQDPVAAMSPRRTVLQALLEPLDHFEIGDPAGRRRKCEEVLETVGMESSVLDRYPHQLSSGQCQRIGIARAVLTEPDLIIADEAVSALDVSVQAQILELIGRLRSERGIAFLFISHDLAVIPQVADHVGVMFRGQIVESAATDSLFSNPCHPYTRELLAAIPDPDPAVAMSPVQSGAGLSRSASVTGCVYAERCPRVMTHCHADEPGMLALESNRPHHVKCHLFSESETEEDGRGSAP